MNLISAYACCNRRRSAFQLMHTHDRQFYVHIFQSMDHSAMLFNFIVKCIKIMWPYLRKPGISDPHAISAMHIFSTLGWNYQSPVFVIFMWKNLSTNLCCHLRRLVVSYKGETSLHFDLPSLYSCCVRTLLLRQFPRAGYLGTARFVKLSLTNL